MKATWSLVSAVALAAMASSGALAACSGSSSGGPDNGSDSGPNTSRDASADHNVSPLTDGSSPTTCPAAVDTTMIPAWKAPKTGTTGACSATDLANINAKAADTSATFSDLFNAITNPTCQACVFSTETDATWQTIVWSPDMASGTAFVNFGACYDLAPSGSAACGKGVQDDEFCLEAACPTTCTDQQGCITAAATGVCKAQGDEVTSGCGSAVTSLNAKCSKFADGLAIVCGSGAAADAGGD